MLSELIYFLLRLGRAKSKDGQRVILRLADIRAFGQRVVPIRRSKEMG